MTGFERLRKEVEGQEDEALKEVVKYLLSRDDMESKYLNEEKNLEGMCEFIKEKGRKHLNNGWSFVTNEVVYAWAVMYYSLPNEFLKIKEKNTNSKTQSNSKITRDTEKTKNNVISLENAKKKIEEKKETKQLSLFGGVV